MHIVNEWRDGQTFAKVCAGGILIIFFLYHRHVTEVQYKGKQERIIIITVLPPAPNTLYIDTRHTRLGTHKSVKYDNPFEKNKQNQGRQGTVNHLYIRNGGAVKGFLDTEEKTLDDRENMAYMTTLRNERAPLHPTTKTH